MSTKRANEIHADVIVIGFGSAGACAAIEAHDSKVEVILLEKQPEKSHYSSTRMSGGGYHSPRPDGNFAALKAYAKAMFSGENLPRNLEGEQPEFSDELAEMWATYAPQNEKFMRGLDPQYQTVLIASAAYADFPGAADSGYAVSRVLIPARAMTRRSTLQPRTRQKPKSSRAKLFMRACKRGCCPAKSRFIMEQRRGGSLRTTMAS